MSAAAKSQGQAMYVVSKDDRLWLLSAQRKLHAQSREHPSYVFEKLWGLVTDPRNLRIAFARVNRNRGRHTGGIDRVTVHHVLQSGVDTFLQQIREELRAGTFRPSPVRRVLIPKAGKPGKHRPLDPGKAPRAHSTCASRAREGRAAARGARARGGEATAFCLSYGPPWVCLSQRSAF